METDEFVVLTDGSLLLPEKKVNEKKAIALLKKKKKTAKKESHSSDCDESSDSDTECCCVENKADGIEENKEAKKNTEAKEEDVKEVKETIKDEEKVVVVVNKDFTSIAPLMAFGGIMLMAVLLVFVALGRAGQYTCFSIWKVSPNNTTATELYAHQPFSFNISCQCLRQELTQLVQWKVQTNATLTRKETPMVLLEHQSHVHDEDGSLAVVVPGLPAGDYIYTFVAQSQKLHGQNASAIWRFTVLDPGKVIGIDLGTSYGCAAVYNATTNTVLPIPLEKESVCLPMQIRRSEQGQYVAMGTGAKRGGYYGDPGTRELLFGLKRHLANRHGQQQDQADYFAVLKPLALMLFHMRQATNEYLGSNMQTPRYNLCVLTVPAHFTHIHRKAVVEAAQLAGWHVTRLVSEPAAAAIAYFHKQKHENEEEKKIVVFDWGGGTVNVALIHHSENAYRVLAADGSRLGGQDIDARVYHVLTQKLLAKYNVAASRFSETLWREAERAKVALSSHEYYAFGFQLFPDGIVYRLEITRAELETVCADLFHDALIPLKNVLQHQKDVKILLVGGSSSIPKIQAMIAEIHNATYIVPRSVLSPLLAVASGAAILGAAELQELSDVTPSALGIKVYPLASDGPDFHAVIPANTAFPTAQMWTANFSTTFDYQQEATFMIYEGSSSYVRDNTLVGSIQVRLPLTEQGTSFVVVGFTIDRNGFLSVSAMSATDNQTFSLNLYGTSSDTRTTKYRLPTKQALIRQDYLDMREKEHQNSMFIMPEHEVLPLSQTPNKPLPSPAPAPLPPTTKQEEGKEKEKEKEVYAVAAQQARERVEKFVRKAISEFRTFARPHFNTYIRPLLPAKFLT